MDTEHTNPDRARFSLFKDLPRDQPIHMLNLVRLREQAVYDDGRQATGAEAYAAYARESGPIFQRLGGSILWSGKPELMLIGPQGDVWDKAFIAVYPTGQAFIDMIRDADYQKAAQHRTAAVRDSRLLRLSPGKAEAGFG
ncbi:DUF1330 domain-containing protein [Pararhodobacter zhoushanensis]|uniref:DUF1330 domain-containing protein n=1 Tax=Pararhodobacter zhoushanensis TaxID=2479545 RepID=A0ABT3GYC1_9RHOB|nr:DUF1330 domain-containing protein [Pararhodobacter zhoushanensis]MCW1932460.1 DUF1330 domain-containing protein [Pararhodobacter zhoushanensis]